MSRLELFSDYLQQSHHKDDGTPEDRGAEQRVVTVTSNNSHTDASNDRDRSAPTTIQSAAAMADPQLMSGHNDANGNAPESTTIIAPESSSPHLTAQGNAVTTTAQSGNVSSTIATSDQKIVRNDQGNGSENGSGSGSGSGSTYTGKAMPSFRRQRASRACETCHARKVRCDAASLGVPCTNCVAFSIECKIPTPKRKKNQKGKDGNSHDNYAASASIPMRRTSIRPDLEQLQQMKEQQQQQQQQQGSSVPPTHPPQMSGPEASPSPAPLPEELNDPNSQYPPIMKPKFARAPIREAGRVAYLGESSNLSLLVHDKHGTSDVVHYPLPEDIRGPRARLCDLDNLEVDILHQRGAFLLPPRSLCDELVDAYFAWVAPVVPIINRTRFMRRYRDPKNPPSLLLLQAMLLAGCRVCTNPQLMDASGSTTPAAMTFYKRAKALFDANYEDDRVTIVQALVLMGWYWEGPEDVTKNVFFWTRVATIVAQGSGMHRSVESSQLSRTDKRLWKRIWWTLFTRDRSVAVALGRPVLINTDDSDVEMITEDDFIEDETETPNGVPIVADFAPDPIHVQFFLQYVKLCEIMGLVLSQQYSVASKARRNNAMDLTTSDVALADWLQNCPREMCWARERHHFWSALLHANYYTTLCLLHRAHMPPANSRANRRETAGQEFGPNGARAYPSKSIAFQAAAMITSIIYQLQAHDQLRFTPAFIVYSLFSALIMHVYQMRSANPSVVNSCHEKISICMQALRDVSHAWLVAKMIHTLFESILGNKAMEEKMQQAAGRRHHHLRQMQKQQGMQQQQQQQQHQYAHNTFAQRQQSASAELGNIPPDMLKRNLSSAHNGTVNPAATNIAAPVAGASGHSQLGKSPMNTNMSPPAVGGNLGSMASRLATGASDMATPQGQGPGQGQPSQQDSLPLKRKFSDIDPIGLPGSGTPAAPVSYERSRPQTPIAAEQGANGDGVPPPQQASENMQGHPAPQEHQDVFLPIAGTGGGTGTTRPHTPFHPPFSFSMPPTPPDFFLVTRNSPNLRQSIWENFQPDQLFPDGAAAGLDLGSGFGLSPPPPQGPDPIPAGQQGNPAAPTDPSQANAIDPNLQASSAAHGTENQSGAANPMITQNIPTNGGPYVDAANPLMTAGDGTQHHHAHQQPPQQPHGSAGGLAPPPANHPETASDDNWSTSSHGASGGPIVPLTLNVEDWFQFFGLNGGFETIERMQ